MKPPDAQEPGEGLGSGSGAGSTLKLADGGARASVEAGGARPGERDLVGRVLAGRYAIERVIGRGGMGIVYEARHVTVGRRVAVKVLRADLARNAEATTRFQREAQIAGAIGHEHIVEVFDFGWGDEGDAYIAMELLEGTDLRALVRAQGPLPEGRAVEVARQVASALGAAHEKGIVHRDLKSENVFVVARDGKDFVKVVDFGISKVLEADENQPITHEGTLLGTPHYMAPEQATSGGDADPRADLYALGCILFEMVTGTLPFVGRTPMEVMYKHVHDPRPRPSDVLPEAGLSHALDALVVRAMAVRREDRPASAAEFIAALPSAGDGRGSIPSLPPRREPRPTGARSRVLVGVGAATVGLIVGVGWWSREETAPPSRRRSPNDVGRVSARVDAAAGGVEATSAPRAEDAGATNVPVVVTLVVRPERANVAWDGADGGVGVLVARALRGTSHTLRASAPGHVTREESVTPTEDTTLRWTLTPTVSTAPVRRAPPVAEAPAQEVAVDAGAAPRTTPDGLKLSPYRRSP